MKAKALFRMLGAVAVVLACAVLPAARADDAQWWSAVMLKHRVNETWTATWRAEPRWTNDASELGTVFTRLSLSRLWNSLTTLSFDYTHVEWEKFDADRGRDRFYEQNWLGVGVANQLDLTPRWQISARHNLHVRWIEDSNSPNVRTRHYVETVWSPENSRLVKGLYAGNEFFVEWANKAAPENRLTPLGLRLKTGERSAMSVFYMVRSTKPDGDWRHAHVLGTYFTYTL